MIAEVVGFGIAGAFLKTLDDILGGVVRFRRKDAGLVVLSGFCIVMAVLILASIDITIMFIGMIVGTVIGKKIDNLVYALGLGVLSPFIIYSLIASSIGAASVGLMIVFGVSAYADELFADREIMDLMFVRRPILKLAAVAVALGGLYSLTGLLALLSFDLAYDLVGYYNGGWVRSYDKTLKKLK